MIRPESLKNSIDTWETFLIAFLSLYAPILFRHLLYVY